MARITIEDCLRKVGSRFELVHLAAQRVRQIREGSEYLVSSPKNEDIVVALREIAAGKITQENMEKAGEALRQADMDTFIENSDEVTNEFAGEDMAAEEDEDLEDDTEEEDEEE